jgi:ketosteroid isomerase-like protein
MTRFALPLLALAAACARAPIAAQPASAMDAATRAVQEQLVARYQENAAAYRRGDLAGVMALRAADFHTVTPDGRTNDRAGMEQYIQGIMNGVRKWNVLDITIDSLRLSGDTAFAIVSQHLDRMALRPDNQVHHVETWVTQREIWIRSGGRWLMWRVDQLRDQRRLVDGVKSP